MIYFPNSKAFTAGVQIHAQMHFMKFINSLGRHTWAMLPNADEFVVVKSHSDLKDYAAAYISPSVPGIALQWLMFGHNDQLYARDKPLSVRFTRRGKRLRGIVKTMFGCAYTWHHPHPHHPVYHLRYRSGAILVGSNSSSFSMPANTKHSAFVPESMEIDAGLADAMVFHYTKSLQEYIARREFRQRPDLACGRGCHAISEGERLRRRNVTLALVCSGNQARSSSRP